MAVSSSSEAWDRTQFTPQHNGRNVLPCMVCISDVLIWGFVGDANNMCSRCLRGC
jgi:hypothetical protein